MPRNNADFAESVLYHGSDHAFSVGDIISPAFSSYGSRPGYAARTFAADNHVLASMFGKHVYEVEPIDPTEAEPTHNIGGVGFEWESTKGFKVKRKVEGHDDAKK